jgi:hypothetical protein
VIEWFWLGKTYVLGEQPVPVPLCPPQISHTLSWDQTRVSTVWATSSTFAVGSNIRCSLSTESRYTQPVCRTPILGTAPGPSPRNGRHSSETRLWTWPLNHCRPQESSETYRVFRHFRPVQSLGQSMSQGQSSRCLGWDYEATWIQLALLCATHKSFLNAVYSCRINHYRVPPCTAKECVELYLCSTHMSSCHGI